MNASRYLSYTSLAAGLLLLTMVGIGLLTGASQQDFEMLMPLESYAAQLLAQATPLRLIIGLDNLFIALYCTAVILLGQILGSDSNRRLLLVFMGAGLTGGVLDYLENHHILGMLHAVEQGLALTESEIKLQMVASMFKWHLAYFAFFLLAFTLTPKNGLERAFRFALLFIQMPIGVFFYVLADTATGDLLFYARYLNLIVGFLLFAFVFRRKPAKPADGTAASALQPAYKS